MFATGLIFVATLGPWTCPEAVCGPLPPPTLVVDTPTHAQGIRLIMRAMPRVRGRRPFFMTSEGETLTRSMRVRSIHRRLSRADGALHVHYGRCATHSRTCPWASAVIELGPADDLYRALPPTHTGSHHAEKVSAPEAFEQEWSVQVARDPDTQLAADIDISGVLGMDRTLLGLLPVRAVTTALRYEPTAHG